MIAVVRCNLVQQVQLYENCYKSALARAGELCPVDVRACLAIIPLSPARAGFAP